MSFLNILGVGGTPEEAQQDLTDRIEMASGMNLVVFEIFTYRTDSLCHAAARMCSKQVKQLLTNPNACDILRYPVQKS